MNHVILLLLTTILTAVNVTAGIASESPQEIGWGDLVPVGWEPEPADGEESFFADDESGPAAIQMSPNAPVVEALDSRYIKIPGFVLPVEFSDDQVSEFLLVPYVGACIHVPPPPGNQIVYVKLREPMTSRDLYEPVWVEGIMRTQSTLSEYANAEYTLEGDNVTKYEWD